MIPPPFPNMHDEAFGVDEVYLHQEDVSVDVPYIDKMLSTLKQMASSESAPLRELNYIFCSDDYLLEMNRTHLQHDYLTDVITFPNLDGAICGDVYISTDRVADNAKQVGVEFERELVRVMLHGALHLAGYTDTDPVQKAMMSAKEDVYLKHYFEQNTSA
jgi:probable rRNA maturation factor